VAPPDIRPGEGAHCAAVTIKQRKHGNLVSGAVASVTRRAFFPIQCSGDSLSCLNCNRPHSLAER
jgi:hypothetical protein